MNLHFELLADTPNSMDRPQHHRNFRGKQEPPTPNVLPAEIRVYKAKN